MCGGLNTPCRCPGARARKQDGRRAQGKAMQGGRWQTGKWCAGAWGGGRAEWGRMGQQVLGALGLQHAVCPAISHEQRPLLCVVSLRASRWRLPHLTRPRARQVVGAVGFNRKRLAIPDDVAPDLAQLIRSCWEEQPGARPSFKAILGCVRVWVRAWVCLVTRWFVCARAHVCVCARARVCVCVCARAACPGEDARAYVCMQACMHACMCVPVCAACSTAPHPPSCRIRPHAALMPHPHPPSCRVGGVLGGPCGCGGFAGFCGLRSQAPAAVPHESSRVLYLLAAPRSRGACVLNHAGCPLCGTRRALAAMEPRGLVPSASCIAEYAAEHHMQKPL